MKLSLPSLPRFQLRSLFVLVFGVAVGMAVVAAKMPQDDAPSDDELNELGLTSFAAIDTSLQFREIAGIGLSGAWAAVTTWLVLGLIHEAYGIWRNLHGRKPVHRDLRFARRFALFWRFALILLLVGYCVVDWIVIGEVLPYVGRLTDAPSLTRETLFYGLILIAVASRRPPTARRNNTMSSFSIVMTIAVWGVACTACVIIWVWNTQVDYLLCIALHGMENARNTPLEGVDPNMADRKYAFVMTTFLAAILVPLNFYWIGWLARHWNGWTKKSIRASVFLGAGLVATMSCSVWLVATGIYHLSPWLDEAAFVRPWDQWLTACLLMLIMVTAAAYRLAVLRHESFPADEQEALPTVTVFFHRWRWLSVAILLVCLCSAVCGIIVLYELMGNLVSLLELVVSGLVEDPRALVGAAIFLAAFGIAVSGIRKSRVKLNCGIAPLPPGRFFTYWALCFLTIACGALPTVWFIFALWLTPWYRLPWLDLGTPDFQWSL